jgi:hypothetical protein
MDLHRMPQDVSPLVERRAHGRRVQERLKCNLGPVLDLSRGGVRVLATRPLAGDVVVRIRTAELEVCLAGEIRWTRRLGLRRHEAGIEFRKVEPDDARKLTRIASDHAKVIDLHF